MLQSGREWLLEKGSGISPYSSEEAGEEGQQWCLCVSGEMEGLLWRLREAGHWGR